MINIRRAETEDMEGIIELVNQVFRKSNNFPPSMHRQFPLFLSGDNCRNLYIAEDEGRIISHNGIIKNTLFIEGHPLSTASMGSVCTHPDYRGQGIATKILKRIFENLHREQISLLTISGGRGLYKRQGAQTTAGKTGYLLNCDDSNAEKKELFCKYLNLPLEFNMQENKIPENVNVMADLYRKESVRYERSRYEFPLLLEAMPTAHDVPYPPHYFTLTASYKNKKRTVAGYIIGYKTRDNNLSVVEYAGESTAVFYLIAKLNNEMVKNKEINQISLEVPFYRQDLIQLLNGAGYCGSPSYYNSTYKITNNERLWQEIRPVIEERAYDKDPGLSLDNLPVDIDDKPRFLHFLFDEYERGSYGSSWDAILPIPLPCPRGLNYI